MRALIATAMNPKRKDSASLFFAGIRESAGNLGLRVPLGIIWTGGFGCSNLAFDVIGPNKEEEEDFINMLCMALQPAKWSITYDSLPDVDTCDLTPSDEK